MLMIDWQSLLTQLGERAIKIALIILIAWFVQAAIIAFLRKVRRKFKAAGEETFAQKEQRIKTLTSLLINASKIIITLLAFLLILSEMGVNILPLLTGVGILGLGVGMGARTLVADLIAGFFILLENQFNVGDKVKLDNTEGWVRKICLRTVILKDKDGNRYIIPNSSIKVVKKIKTNPKKS